MSLSYQEARIVHIDIEADRYGRLRPCLWLSTLWNPMGRHQPEHPRLHLPSLEAILADVYAVGDLVAVQYYGAIPKITKVLASNGEPCRPLFVASGLCSHCQLPLKTGHGQYYCTAESCPLKLYAQLRYAIRPDVLDLPFDKDILDEILWGRELIDDVSGLCFLEPATLQGMSLHPDEVAVIVEVLQRRQLMLAGHYRTTPSQAIAPAEVQRLTRGRFLDALSLPGLYRPTIQTLLSQLDRGAWSWEDLAQVLIDRSTLIHYGVSRVDAQTIAKHAYPRGLEFDRLARTF